MTGRRQVLIRETSSVWILSCSRWHCVRTIHRAREKGGLFLATVLLSWACLRMLTFDCHPPTPTPCPLIFLWYCQGVPSAIFTEDSMRSLFHSSDFLSYLYYNLIILDFQITLLALSGCVSRSHKTGTIFSPLHRHHTDISAYAALLSLNPS